MVLSKIINKKAKSIDNTGIGAKASMYGDRWFNKNGKPNLEKRGVPIHQRWSLYHSMLQMSRVKFLLVLFTFFFAVNLFFAAIYAALGLDQLVGLNETDTLSRFKEAFIFSAQTFTTVGYGRLSPSGFAFSLVAGIEAFCGLLSLAIATGVLYGRFSKPTAYICFSDIAIIAPFKDGIALMLRLAPYKNTTYTDAEAKLTIGFMVEEGGKRMNKFYPMNLEYDRVNALPLSWTIVHPIDEESPLFGLTMDDLLAAKAEILVFLKTFDDTYSNVVVTRTSYTAAEIVQGAKFEPMYHSSEDRGTTILDFEKLNSHQLVENIRLTGISNNNAGKES